MKTTFLIAVDIEGDNSEETIKNFIRDRQDGFCAFNGNRISNWRLHETVPAQPKQSADEKFKLLSMIFAGEINPEFVASALAEVLGVTRQEIVQAQRDRDARGAITCIHFEE